MVLECSQMTFHSFSILGPLGAGSPFDVINEAHFHWSWLPWLRVQMLKSRSWKNPAVGIKRARFIVAEAVTTFL